MKPFTATTVEWQKEEQADIRRPIVLRHARYTLVIAHQHCMAALMLDGVVIERILVNGESPEEMCKHAIMQCMEWVR